MLRPARKGHTLVVAVFLIGCGPHVPVKPLLAPRSADGAGMVGASRQLVVVTTPSWTSTSGTMVRFERASTGSNWIRVAAPSPVVVGRAGIAWGAAFDQSSNEGPSKHEGDGKAPAGVFPLDTVFGFAPADSMSNVRLPYVQLLATTDCVDDTASTHYNTVVDKSRLARVDWNSAEHMREVGQYEIGVIVGYNAAPALRGRGSCIFLHIWAGPDSHTAGCTAFDEAKLRDVIDWLDADRRPLLVQLTASEYERLRGAWRLPAL
jgi:zinc D-Ala-D-Ala dipeptidase